MVCCKPALTAKMNNMTNGAQSGHDFLCLYAKNWMSLLPMVISHILILGTLQTFRNQLFLLFKYNLIVTQMSGT